MTLLFILIAMAILSIQIATDSSLAQDVKGLFGLSFDKPKWLISFAKYSFWKKAFTKYLLPVNLLFALIFLIYNKVNEAVNCSRCLSFWMGSLGSHLYGESLVDSVIYGLCTILITVIVERIDI